MDKDPTLTVIAVIILAVSFGILGYLLSGIIRRWESNPVAEHQESIKEFLQHDQPSKPDPNQDQSQQ